MKVGDKTRNLRTIKGLSQENMANLLGMSLVAYGDIERNKKDVNLSRLEQISEALGVAVTDILTFGEKIANFFDNCNGVSGVTNGIFNNFDAKEIQHELDKAKLLIDKLTAEKAKAEMEAMYWREKCEKV
jgi:transcriptional regulator with XRE-family HTH domain